MCKKAGFSVFVSQFDASRDRLRALWRDGAMVFTSFHIAEEFDDTYAERARLMCEYLDGLGYSIIGDVSKRTLEIFRESDIVAFAERMHLSILRIDYGFSDDEIDAVARRMPVCVNASTAGSGLAASLAKDAVHLYAMHNYYPRPETGLDSEFFDAINRGLSEAGVESLAFVAGDGQLRGPLYRGLPTLEKHRGIAPYAAFVDLDRNHRVDGVFVGDGLIGEFDAECIAAYLETGVIAIPVAFDPEYRYLEGTAFTVRADSPARLMRLQESREYATQGKIIAARNAAARNAGAVTIDNEGYLRYSGEIQIVRENLAADPNVNVIGTIGEKWHPLLSACRNGGKIRFVREP